MREIIPVQQTMALVNQRIEQFMWLLLVSMHWKKLWLILNTDAISLYFLCSIMSAVIYLYWCLAKYIHAGLHASSIFPKITFNCKTVIMKIVWLQSPPPRKKKIISLMIKRLYMYSKVMKTNFDKFPGCSWLFEEIWLQTKLLQTFH